MTKLFPFVFLFIVGIAQAQELNCSVVVNADKVPGTNTQVFKTLQKSLSDFVNKTTWTNQKFKPNERISCSMFITIDEVNANQFKGSIQVQSSRTAFNSSYTTTVLNCNDKDFTFDYTEFQNLNYNPNLFDTNLVSVVAFYSLIIIGLDADTYVLDGGLPYYETAQQIVDSAQSSGASGWNQGSNLQNRYYLVNNLLSNTYSSYRDAMYEYHAEGLDIMNKDLKAAKLKIVDSIAKLNQLELSRPNSFLTRLFFDAKTDEIISIFTGGPVVPVDTLVNNLYTISPLNSSKWADIK